MYGTTYIQTFEPFVESSLFDQCLWIYFKFLMVCWDAILWVTGLMCYHEREFIILV